MIRKDDDLFHPFGTSPFWNESGIFIFMVPERSLSGYVYIYHRPNMSLSAGGVGLWDPSGDQVYDCLYHELDECQPFPTGAEMFECSLPSGLSVTTIDLQQSYGLTYKGANCELELRWDAIMAPHELAGRASSHQEEVNPGIEGFLNPEDEAEPIARETNGHYEQIGRMTGTLALGAERIPVDGWSLRDHSWGPRTRQGMRRAAWPWAVASETSSFQAVAVSPLPASQDPVVATTEDVAGGWYVKDGILGELVSGQRRVIERGSDGRQLRELFTATDHLGRELQAEGVCVNLLKWPTYVEWMDWWSLCRWSFDGEEAWGESHDWMSYEHSRRFLRTLRQR